MNGELHVLMSELLGRARGTMPAMSPGLATSCQMPGMAEQILIQIRTVDL